MANRTYYRVLTTGGQTGLSVTNGAVVSLTVPAQAVRAVVFVKGGQLNFFTDARTPTTTATGNGAYALANDQIVLNELGELAGFRCIAATSTNCTLDVTYYS